MYKIDYTILETILSEFLKLISQKTSQQYVRVAPRYQRLQKREVTGVVPGTDLEKEGRPRGF